MFATVLNPKNIAEVQARLEELTEQSQRRWGTMTPAGMLYHLRAQQESAMAIVPNPPMYKSYAQHPVMRWLFIYILPWPRGFRTAKAFDANKQSDKVQLLEEEKKLFIDRLEKFIVYPNPLPHPLFGDLSKKMWSRMVYKHIDYHFRQFGV